MHQSERWNTILWSTSPPKCEAQTARMAMSISETLQRLQATKVSNRSGGATGSKGPKTADLEVRHYVPRLEKIPVGYWNDTPRIIFSFGYVFFFWGGGKGGLNEWWWQKRWNTNWLLPGRLGGRFLSGWHPSPWNLRCIRSLVMSWMRRWNMWWPRFRLTFHLWKVGYDGNVAEGFLWVTWVTWVTWVLKHSLHVFRLEPSFRKDFFCVPLFFRLAPKGAQWIGAIPRIVPRSRTPWNSPSWNVPWTMRRKSEILNVPWVWVWGDTTWDLQRLRMFIFETKRAITFPGFCVWLKRGETCHQPEEVQGVLSSIFVGWLDDWMHKNMWGLIWLDDQPPHW